LAIIIHVECQDIVGEGIAVIIRDALQRYRAAFLLDKGAFGAVGHRDDHLPRLIASIEVIGSKGGEWVRAGASA